MDKIGNGWDEVLKEEYEKDYFKALEVKLAEEYRTQTVFPPFDLIFSALRFVNYSDVKAVILGQDPYHNVGQANGLSFAVNEGIMLPPSLVNIYKEIQEDIGCTMPATGSLIGWAKQGVLLLNTVLSVRRGQPQSHAGLGWQTFTDRIICALNERQTPLAFILWGSNAIGKKDLIGSRHFVVTSPHPSPLSAYRGFFGSKPFSRVNAFLSENGIKPVDWSAADDVCTADYYNAKGKITRV